MLCVDCGSQYFRKSDCGCCPTCESERRLKLPTPSEIKLACWRIQNEWTDSEEQQHRTGQRTKRVSLSHYHHVSTGGRGECFEGE